MAEQIIKPKNNKEYDESVRNKKIKLELKQTFDIESTVIEEHS